MLHAISSIRGNSTSRSRNHATAHGASIANTSAIPPTRGTARLWNFWTPSKSVSPVKFTCSRRYRTSNSVNTSETRNEPNT